MWKLGLNKTNRFVHLLWQLHFFPMNLIQPRGYNKLFCSISWQSDNRHDIIIQKSKLNIQWIPFWFNTVTLTLNQIIQSNICDFVSLNMIDRQTFAMWSSRISKKSVTSCYWFKLMCINYEHMSIEFETRHLWTLTILGLLNMFISSM